MDFNRIQLENNQYIIEVKKEKRLFSYTEFGQYTCSIIFKDSINNIVLQIDCTEKEYLYMLQSLNFFCMNLGYEQTDIIHFDTGNVYSYFWFVATLEEYLKSYPDDEEPKLGISIFQSYMNNNNILRLYFEITYYFLEELIYQLFLLIEDLPNFQELNKSFLDDMSYELTERYYEYKVGNLYDKNFGNA